MSMSQQRQTYTTTALEAQRNRQLMQITTGVLQKTSNVFQLKFLNNKNRTVLQKIMEKYPYCREFSGGNDSHYRLLYCSIFELALFDKKLMKTYEQMLKQEKQQLQSMSQLFYTIKVQILPKIKSKKDINVFYDVYFKDKNFVNYDNIIINTFKKVLQNQFKSQGKYFNFEYFKSNLFPKEDKAVEIIERQIDHKLPAELSKFKLSEGNLLDLVGFFASCFKLDMNLFLIQKAGNIKQVSNYQYGGEFGCDSVQILRHAKCLYLLQQDPNYATTFTQQMKVKPEHQQMSDQNDQKRQKKDSQAQLECSFCKNRFPGREIKKVWGKLICTQCNSKHCDVCLTVQSVSDKVCVNLYCQHKHCIECIKKFKVKNHSQNPVLCLVLSCGVKLDMKSFSPFLKQKNQSKPKSKPEQKCFYCKEAKGQKQMLSYQNNPVCSTCLKNICYICQKPQQSKDKIYTNILCSHSYCFDCIFKNLQKNSFHMPNSCIGNQCYKLINPQTFKAFYERQLAAQQNNQSDIGKSSQKNSPQKQMELQKCVQCKKIFQESEIFQGQCDHKICKNCVKILQYHQQPTCPQYYCTQKFNKSVLKQWLEQENGNQMPDKQSQNRKQSSSSPKKQTGCGKCQKLFLADDVYFSTCGHQFCMDCLKSLYFNKMLMCPMLNCFQRLSKQDIKLRLEQDDKSSKFSPQQQDINLDQQRDQQIKSVKIVKRIKCQKCMSIVSEDDIYFTNCGHKLCLDCVRMICNYAGGYPMCPYGSCIQKLNKKELKLRLMSQEDNNSNPQILKGKDAQKKSMMHGEQCNRCMGALENNKLLEISYCKRCKLNYCNICQFQIADILEYKKTDFCQCRCLRCLEKTQTLLHGLCAKCQQICMECGLKQPVFLLMKYGCNHQYCQICILETQDQWGNYKMQRTVYCIHCIKQQQNRNKYQKYSPNKQGYRNY